MFIFKKTKFIIFYFFTPVIIGAQSGEWDTDRDAMPNGWEFHRQLDVNDPRDAWKDPDADSYINLYEYLLGSDPQDPNQPATVNYDPGTPLEEVIGGVSRGAVLRLPAGHFYLNYQHKSFGEAPRLLIQGGWKPDYSERDVCRYRTTLDGESNGSILSFLIVEGNSAALILDGIEFVRGSRGVVQFTSFAPKSQLLIANCLMSKSDVHRNSSMIYFEDAPSALISDFIVVNSIIANNSGTGIKAIQHANHSNIKVLHSLLGFNRPAMNDAAPFVSGFGMVLIPASDSSVQIQVANSLFWKNEVADLWIDPGPSPNFVVNSNDNIYGFIDDEETRRHFSDPSNRSIDPILLRDNADQFYLASNSPAIMAGSDLGVLDLQNPDIGPSHCSPALNTQTVNNDRTNSAFKVFPNPVSKDFILATEFATPCHLEVSIYDHSGRLVSRNNFGRQLPGKAQFNLMGSLLRPGLHYLVCSDGKAIKVLKLLKKK